MDRGAWQATVHSVSKELDTTEATQQACRKVVSKCCCYMVKMPPPNTMGYFLAQISQSSIQDEEATPMLRSCQKSTNLFCKGTGTAGIPHFIVFTSLHFSDFSCFQFVALWQPYYQAGLLALISPTVFAHVILLCHILVIFTICQTFFVVVILVLVICDQ